MDYEKELERYQVALEVACRELTNVVPELADIYSTAFMLKIAEVAISIRDKRRTRIFVFGSNLQGRHGKGAALEALKNHGAILGQGEGLQGRSYAIPTKRTPSESLHLGDVMINIETFKKFAKEHPEMEFQVTRVGCGLAGFDESDIAPQFANAPDNCILPDGWRE